MFDDPYEDIQSWSTYDLEEELERLHKDQISGRLGDDHYRSARQIVLEELFRREDEELRVEAYDRAMKGI